MYFFTAIGITIGYHRMLTHRSFEAQPIVRCLFLLLGSMAVEGPALDWASIHIKHHANTDTEDDPTARWTASSTRMSAGSSAA
jgi:stearoyl-CoA desaturase (delta-9 desaturase)